MNVYDLSAVLFLVAYFINLFYITVLYHRGLTHGAVELRPALRRWTVATGNWVTGIDPKSWACMHRLHHLHSDTELDPHSPVRFGTLGVASGQLHSYRKTLVGLIKKNKQYADLVRDLEFPVHWLNRTRYWYLPYLLHFSIAVAISFLAHHWLPGLAYLGGILSHPVQGWLVNALAHRYGYRNHEIQDHSRNNPWVAWVCMGEGYQNNHHADPSSAKFSERWHEFDLGYGMCLISEKIKLLRIVPHAREQQEVHP